LEELLKHGAASLGWSAEDAPSLIREKADRVYAESMLKSVLDAQATASGGGRSVLWRLIGYLKPYRRSLAWGALGAVAMTAATLAPSWITGRLIDGVVRPYEGGRLGAEEASRLLGWLTAGVAATYAVKEFFAWLRFRSMSVLGEFVAGDLRREIYAHLQKQSVDFFSSRNSGSLVSRVTSDTDRLWDFIAFGVVEVFVSLLMLVGIGAVLISLDLKLGLLMCLPVPLLLGAIWWHGERMRRLFLRCWRKWSRMTAIVSDTLPGIKVVKAFRREEQEASRFEKANADFLEEAERIHSAWTVFWPSLMFGIHALLLGVWVFGGPRLLGHGEPLSAGTFISFVLYAGLFVQPVEIIGQLSRMMNRAVSSAHRVFEILDAEPKVKEPENPVDPGRLRGAIAFERVSFSYDGLRSVVKDVSFEVRPGEMIGLVGSSGGGKSTLTSLIARFHDVTRGRVLIDGLDLRELELGSYRRQVGMVLQDPYLFHGTILENIRYGRPEASLAEVVRAARAAHVHEFVTRLPHGYDTVVGERGHTLSGGERQRVSIARALLQDPRVLILDEATSSVDTETERKIQDALDRLVQGRTTIAIAHRLSTLRKADRLLVVKEGRIVEQGTHDQLLLVENGVYRKLHELQNEKKSVEALFLKTEKSAEEALCN
jgi:ATP-binding cassette subfamily B protein